MQTIIVYLTAVFVTLSSSALAQNVSITPLRTVVDINIGETRKVILCDGNSVTVALLAVEETRDVFRDAVRQTSVSITVDGYGIVLNSATYNLPASVEGIRIDCPITKGYYKNNTRADAWGLDQDVRLRLWPEDDNVTKTAVRYTMIVCILQPH